MATAKKPAAKKAASKKPAKKPAAKKSAAKKGAAKKPAAKKPAVKKPAAKKPAAKKPAAKAGAAKKPAAKPAAKKPAAKAAPAKKPASDNVKMRHLFDAFSTGTLPRSNGYIISSFFSERTAYSIYEIVSYSGVKEIFQSGEGLQFIAGGKKLHILVENATYEKKFIEPVSRDKGESIPKRFDELEKITAANQTSIFVAKEPLELSGSFTVLKPTSINFAVVFYDLPDVYENVEAFFENSLNRFRKVPQADARKAGKAVVAVIQKYMGFKGQFE
jgi:hypothetical protein